jgi:hypothetical protein
MEALMARFSDRMVPEMVQAFWAPISRGEFVTAAAAEAGTYREKGTSSGRRALASRVALRSRRPPHTAARRGSSSYRALRCRRATVRVPISTVTSLAPSRFATHCGSVAAPAKEPIMR